MRLTRLRGGEQLAAFGGGVLLIAMFLPWFGKVSPFCTPLPGHSCGHNFNAWQKLSFTDLVLFLSALGGLLTAFFAAGPKTDGAITTACLTVPVAALATLLTLLRVIDPVGRLDPRYGIYIGLAASAAVAYGCWRAVRDEKPSRVARPARRRPASQTR